MNWMAESEFDQVIELTEINFKSCRKDGKEETVKNNVSESELKLAIDLIRVCDLSSEVLAITEARRPIEEVQIIPT